MRTHIDHRSCAKVNYVAFCKSHPTVKITYDDWKKVIYGFNEMFKEYILETGEKARFPHGFGEFSVVKKRRKEEFELNGRRMINLYIDWKKTREKGKIIYNFNDHTNGYFFGWYWFKTTARMWFPDLWYFKPARSTSRLLAHYIKLDPKYQHLYKEWLNHR